MKGSKFYLWYNKMLIICSLLIFVMMAVSCSKNVIPKKEEVKEVIVHIGGNNQQENTYFKLTTKENIEEIIRKHDQLNNYKDNDCDTWKLDVEINYILKDGSEKNVLFKGIRPVDDILENIYNSEEVKKQTIDIFKINPDDIDKVKFSACDKDYTWVTYDKQIIMEAYKNTAKYYINHSDDQLSYSNAYVDFYIHGNEVANGMVLREDKQWDDMYKKYSEFRRLRISPEEVKRIELRDESDKKIVIKDIQTIEKILDSSYVSGWTNDSEISVDIILKEGKRKTLHNNYKKYNVPDFVYELLE